MTLSARKTLVITTLLPLATALIGYDCGGQGMNITTLSLLDIGDCDVGSLEPKEEKVYVQLMQTSDYDRVTITQCRIEIDRTISYCGMHSHTSVVHNGRREYIQEVGEQACRRIHDTGSITIVNAILDGLTKNSTNFRSATLAGSVSVDGRCSGSQYSDGYGNWENVVVQASIKITLRSSEAPVKRASGQVILPVGTKCTLSRGYCMDAEGTETYWPILPTDTCHFDRYDILYEGIAAKLTSRNNPDNPIIYTVTSQDTTFALTKTHEINVCGYTLLQTEHPKLFILETKRGATFKTRSKISVDNLDIFAYVNSKFIYVEKHIKTQLSKLYRDIMEQKCALERQVLQNALSLASIAPDEMAIRLMKGPGYTAVTSGEVIHMIKCIPVECKIRHTEDCYNELPITRHNESFFLLPRSRIITRKGTVRDCHGLLPAMYKIENTWYRVAPRPMETLPPPIIEPLSQPKWHYTSPAGLAASGIYSTDDLDRLRTHIMFPVEKPAMINNIAQGAMGNKVAPGSISMIGLLDEATLDHIAENTGRRIWKGFMSFGSASAGILAIFLIIRFVKLCMDTIIHGYVLHTVYGWSLHLLGALWSSVTHLLLHLGGKPTREREPDIPKEDKPHSTIEALHPPSTSKADFPEEKVPHKYTYASLRQYIDGNN
ncbi:uncharacterized protein [Cardiocondyla obscurior]|uniref:uncharacterized protein n=1 Tax=Cardiocondyla obscurior TaxID=286306 RepID=UPI00396567B9